MHPRVTIIYNQPAPSRYDAMGEGKAVVGVLEEVEAVQGALVARGYPVVRLPLSPPLEAARGKLKALETGLVFNLFEGFDGSPGTEALVAGIVSELGFPCTGSPARALALCMDKVATKEALIAGGVATPRYQVLTPGNLPGFHLALPCIVKPCGEDASHGISAESVAHDPASLERQVEKVSRLFGGKALVEEFVEGREFNATVLGNAHPVVLPLSEIAYDLPLGMPRVLTFASKWESADPYFRGTGAICPASVSAEERNRLAKAALTSFRLMGCRGYARVDMRQDAKGEVKVLEVNPNPDVSPGAGAAIQAAAAGMTYDQFIERIVLLALEREGL